MASHQGPSATPWTYRLVSMGNPLNADVEERANALGRLGWELVAIDAGVWVFKRPAAEEADESLESLLQETVPMVEAELTPAVSTIVLRAPAS